ncbi:MAG: hypothetical protein N2738_09825, partial [Thermodesulfovibrionales bacterium]|nr:hypothetical protein [Thermodesulfovibrionales bacterium]
MTDNSDLKISEKILSENYRNNPRDISVISLYCEVLYNLRKFEDVFNILLKIEDSDLMLIMLKSFFIRLYNEKFYNDALRLSFKLYDYPLDKNFLLIIGIVNYLFKIHDVAENILLSYIELGGKDKQAFLCLADMSHSVKRDSNLAYEYYLKAIDTSGNQDKLVFHQIGLQCFALGRYEEAIRYFHLAGDYKKKHIEGYFTEGLSYFFIGQYEIAHRCINEVIKTFGNYPPAEFMLEHLSTTEKGIRLKEYANLKCSNIKMAQSLGTILKPYIESLESKIFCHRDKIWHSTNFYNDLDGLLLYSLISILKPKHVIEFSPYRGYSTVFIYEALRNTSKNFTFKTFDLCECNEFTDMIRLFNIDIKVTTGDAIFTVPQYIIENSLIGEIGFCHIDSLHEYDFAKNYTEKILPL